MTNMTKDYFVELIEDVLLDEVTIEAIKEVLPEAKFDIDSECVFDPYEYNRLYDAHMEWVNKDIEDLKRLYEPDHKFVVRIDEGMGWYYTVIYQDYDKLDRSLFVTEIVVDRDRLIEYLRHELPNEQDAYVWKNMGNLVDPGEKFYPENITEELLQSINYCITTY